MIASGPVDESGAPLPPSPDDYFGVYTSTLGGGEATLLTSDAWRELNRARVSPDGEWIVLTRFNKRDWTSSGRERFSMEQSEILRMRADGSGLETLIPARKGYANYNARWTPDGRALLYTSNDNEQMTSQIHRLDLESGEISVIRPTPEIPDAVSMADADQSAGRDGPDAPDGGAGRDGDDGIDARDGRDGRDAGDGRDASGGINANDASDGPDTPDGGAGRDASDGNDASGANDAQIVFAVQFRRGLNNVSHLWLMNTDGSEPRPLTQPEFEAPPPELFPPTLNPVKALLAYRRRIKSSIRQERKHDPSGDHEPAFSPDGGRVAFMRFYRNWDIRMMVVEVETGEETELSFPLMVDSVPAWSGDGERLIFWHVDHDDPAMSGVYSVRPDGADRAKVPTPVGLQTYLPSFFPDDGSEPGVSGPNARIVFSARMGP